MKAGASVWRVVWRYTTLPSRALFMASNRSLLVSAVSSASLLLLVGFKAEILAAHILKRHAVSLASQV